MKSELEIHTEIVIKSDKAKVWSILTNTSGYTEWNPFIVSMSGTIKEGERLVNVMKNSNGTITFKPKVLKVVEHQYFEWLGHLWLPNIFDGRHYFEIVELPDGFVKLKHGERFSGLLAKLIFKKIGEDTKDKFIQMNQAIKSKAEKTSN